MSRPPREEAKNIRVPLDLIPKVQQLIDVHNNKIKKDVVLSNRPSSYFTAVAVARNMTLEELRNLDQVSFYRRAVKRIPDLNRWYGYLAFNEVLAERANAPVITSSQEMRDLQKNK